MGFPRKEMCFPHHCQKLFNLKTLIPILCTILPASPFANVCQNRDVLVIHKFNGTIKSANFTKNDQPISEVMLRKSNITRIEHGAFENVTEIEIKLDLLPDMTKKEATNMLGQIRQLTMIGAKTRFSPDAFGNLKYLTEVIITDMPNTFDKDRLTSEFFKSSSMITKLVLTKCKLKAIKAGSFSSMVNLVILDLTDNSVEQIETGTFDALRNMRELYLQKNPLKKMTGHQIPYLAKLEYLHFGHEEHLKVLNYAEIHNNLPIIVRITMTAILMCKEYIVLAKLYPELDYFQCYA